MTTKVISGLSDVATSYKCLLLDQFGVIHDGQRIYPGALNALLQAHRSGLKNVIISNSSQRASNTLRKLQRFNIDSACISAVVTSGELAFKKLPIFAARNPNARVLHFNWGSSRNPVSIHDHGFSCLAPCTRSFCGVSVPAAEDVDVIVAHGTDGFVCHDGSMTSLDWDVAIRLICDIAKSSPQVPFFCANPDLVTVDGATLRRMPGSLAKAFEDAGGKSVYRLGKPDPAIYIEALQVAGVDRGDILAVGDSLAHDVLGASDAGIDTLYVVHVPKSFYYHMNFISFREGIISRSSL